jgi:hypothetical protein
MECHAGNDNPKTSFPQTLCTNKISTDKYDFESFINNPPLFLSWLRTILLSRFSFSMLRRLFPIVVFGPISSQMVFVSTVVMLVKHMCCGIGGPGFVDRQAGTL